MNKILVGSRAFFTGIEGFEPHDYDYVELEENPTMYKNVMLIKLKDCYYMWRKMSADEFVLYSLSSGPAMQLGKFLVPEFCKAIDFNIEHLKCLRPLRDALDERHMYELIIYDAYIENNDFILSDEQRMKAFEAYKKERING